MTTRTILVALCTVATYLTASGQCSPPQAAVEKLTAYFAYQNGLGANKPISEGLSALSIGDRVFFRPNNQPPEYDPDFRPVYVYKPGRSIDEFSCPSDITWMNCVADSVLNPNKDTAKIVYGEEENRRYTSPAPKEMR